MSMDTQNAPEFSDEEITAFLDGELDIDRSQILGEALESDAELQRRVEELTVDTALIKAAFEKVTPDRNSDDVVASLSTATAAANTNLPGKQRGFSIAQLAACALIALGIGYVAGNFLNTPPPAQQQAEQRGWKAYVAAYQALYSAETLASVDFDLTAQQRQLRAVNERVGTNITIADLSSVEGLTFKRAQTLSFKGKPLIQLAFVTDEGQPVALCIIAKPGVGNASMAETELEGMKAASWIKDGFDFLLIGNAPAETISKSASAFSARI